MPTAIPAVRVATRKRNNMNSNTLGDAVIHAPKSCLILKINFMLQHKSFLKYILGLDLKASTRISSLNGWII